MYMRALRGYEKAWGAEHTSTLETVNNLGNLYSDQGKMAEAEELWLRITKKGMQNNHAWSRVVDSSLRRLLSLYRRRAFQGVSFRAGQRSRLLSAFTSPQCKPTVIWSKVFDLRDLLENSPEPYLYCVGGILLGIGDEPNAVYAFQYCKETRTNIYCDGCNHIILPDKSHYTCKSCDSRDFCNNCWLLCQSDDVQEHSNAIADCTGHNFCKVPGLERTEVRELSDAKRAAKAWITNLFVYGPALDN
jgi:hypothetical protein